jgi:transcriptional regulator with XRE-family HTH domain
MRFELKAETAGDFLRGLRRELRVTQSELARATWFDRESITRIELGREPRLPTLRRLIAALGGRMELVARFERPLEALAEDFVDRRDATFKERCRKQHERNLKRWAARKTPVYASR